MSVRFDFSTGLEYYDSSDSSDYCNDDYYHHQDSDDSDDYYDNHHYNDHYIDDDDCYDYFRSDSCNDSSNFHNFWSDCASDTDSYELGFEDMTSFDYDHDVYESEMHVSDHLYGEKDYDHLKTTDPDYYYDFVKNDHDYEVEYFGSYFQLQERRKGHRKV